METLEIDILDYDTVVGKYNIPSVSCRKYEKDIKAYIAAINMNYVFLLELDEELETTPRVDRKELAKHGLELRNTIISVGKELHALCKKIGENDVKQVEK